MAAAPAAAQEMQRAVAIEREVQRIAHGSPLWPGFLPLEIPLATYTGDSTFLFRHPAPPDGFTAMPSTPVVHVYPGRHPSVTSNSSAKLGDVMTATLLADGARASQSPAALAAVALHESFHVYQRMRYPAWSANEGDLLLYPAGAPSLLALRRLETEAFRRARAAGDSATSACWTRQALAERRERFADMDSAFVAYERLSELNEGLASYVQMRAAGRAVDTIPEAGFPATAIRHRVYATGPVLGTLLDTFRPEWKAELAADASRSLDDLLGEALIADVAANPSCGWSDADRRRITAAAHDDAKAVIAARAQRRRAFESHAGWRLVIRPAEGRPLWPQGFDPLNTELIDGGVLHTRFLELGNDDGRLRMIDEGDADLTALTVGAGVHPLFNGVREVTVIGSDTPEVARDESGSLSISMPGLTASFPRATVVEHGRTIVVRLAPAP